MGSRRLPVLLCALFLLGMAPLMPASADEIDDWHDHVVISEVLASASSASYNGTDWNGGLPGGGISSPPSAQSGS